MGHNSELQIDMMQSLADTMQGYENGNVSALDAFIELRQYKDQAQTVIDAVKQFESENLETIANDASEYPNGYKGFEIKAVNGRKAYDFSKVSEVQELTSKLKEAQSKYKSMLDARIKGAVHANISEDGEELELPEIKYSKSYLKVTKA